MRPRLIDLFCGIGGLGLGAARAGFDIALSVDNDPVLLGTHELNFPASAHLNADISGLSGSRLLAAANLPEGDLAALVGGSPCQGFSRIGKHDDSDKRNALFVHFFRLVSETKPAFFLAENVLGILESQNVEVVERSMEIVRPDYRILTPLVLNAADFGAPTIRKRVFFVGYRTGRISDLSARDFEKIKCRRKITVESALSGLPRKLRDNWLTDETGWRTLRVRKRGRFWEKIYGDIPEGVGDDETMNKFSQNRLVSACIATRHKAKIQRRFAEVQEGARDLVSRMPRLRRDGLCPTLRAGTGPDRGSFQALRPLHFSEPRVITPREAARLQGFPDWFRFHSTKWHAFRGIGNSVSPLVAEAVLRVLASNLKPLESATLDVAKLDCDRINSPDSPAV